jgi:radical SAM-linked protein
MMRVRIRYSKLGKVRFLSHRDLARVLERAVRKAGLPVAYSQGFSPHAKLHFGLALSVGFESLAEYLDVDLEPERSAVDVAGLPARLDPCVPTGVEIDAAVELVPGTASLQDAVTSSSWSFELPGVDPGELEAAGTRLLAADELPLELVRKGKQVREDLRPLLLDLVVGRTADGARLTAELGTKPRSVRPAEFLLALGPIGPLGHPLEPARVLRTHQWITTDGVRREPIELAAPSPHAQVRAS